MEPSSAPRSPSHWVFHPQVRQAIGTPSTRGTLGPRPNGHRPGHVGGARGAYVGQSSPSVFWYPRSTCAVSSDTRSMKGWLASVSR